MTNFNNVWKTFLNESGFQNGQSIQEITDDEVEHIRPILDRMEEDPDALAFGELFDGKNRLVIDFPTTDDTSEIGRFIDMIENQHGLTVDYAKGMVSAERKFKAAAPDITGVSYALGGKEVTKKFQMKIGKYFAKLEELFSRWADIMREADKTLQKSSGPTARPKLARIWIGRGDFPKAFTPETLKNYFNTVNQLALYTNINPSVVGHWNRAEKFLAPTARRKYVADAEERRQTQDEEDKRRGKEPRKRKPVVAPRTVFGVWAEFWVQNADYIKKNIDDIKSGNKYSMVITRHPIDVLRMADFDPFESCHSPPSRQNTESYYKCAVAEAHGEGAVAYVVETADLLATTDSGTIEEAEGKIQEGELFADEARYGVHGHHEELEPVSRLRLRLANAVMGGGEVSDIAVPEARVYGEPIAGLQARLLKWAQEKQAHIVEKLPRTKDGKYDLGKIHFRGGSYSDSGGEGGLGVRFRELIGVDRTETIGNVNKDNTTEEGLPSHVGALIDQWTAECTEIADKWNDMMKYIDMGFDVEDDGAGGVYIQPSAKISIQIPRTDFSRLPNHSDVNDLVSEAGEYFRDVGYGYVGSITYSHMPRNHMIVGWNIDPEAVPGMPQQDIYLDPEILDDLGAELDKIDSLENDHQMFSKKMMQLFKRDGWMSGGTFQNWALELYDDNDLYYEWSATIVEPDEPDEFYEIELKTTDTIINLADFVDKDKYTVKWKSGNPTIASINNYPVAYVYSTGRGEEVEVSEAQEGLNGYYDTFAKAKQNIEAILGENDYAYDRIISILNSRDFSIALKKAMGEGNLTDGMWMPNWNVSAKMAGSYGDEGDVEIEIAMASDADDPDAAVASMKSVAEEWDDNDELNAMIAKVAKVVLTKELQESRVKGRVNENKKIVNTWKEFLKS